MDHQKHFMHKGAKPVIARSESSEAIHESHNHHHHSLGDLMHREHHKLMISDFKKRFFWSIFLTIPLLILSPMIQTAFHYDLQFWGSDIFLLIFATVIFLYGGWPFLQGLLRECREKNPGMMTLIGIAIFVAYIYSTLVVFGFGGKTFFWELATLIDIMLLGHWIEMSSVLGASKSLELLVSMMPATAHLILGDKIEDIKLEELNGDDVVLVWPGEKIPADGIIVDGKSNINEAMLTGESLPVGKIVGKNVIGGSINGEGSIKVKVKGIGRDSYLAKVIDLVQKAQKSKSKTELLANRAARWLTFIALSVGFVSLIIWLLLGKSFGFSLERAVTVMVISCPHALGLAIPLVVAISTSLLAQHGLLIRNRNAFESAHKVTLVIFDKTGTLTKGEFGVRQVENIDESYTEDEIIKYAASLEEYSEHPIAKSIVRFAKKKKIDLFNVQDFEALTGMGASALVSGKNVKVGSHLYLQNNSMSQDIIKNSDETTVFVVVDNNVVGYITLADKIREESYEAVKILKKKNIKVIMITGDNENVARVVSSKLNLDDYYAEVLPHQKLEIIKRLQSEGEIVAMVGDGVNDAPALAIADVGIAIGSGTDIAAETADVILVKSDPKDISSLIMFSQATYKKMIQNLLWATGYNVFAIPLAAGILYGLGVILSPAVGAILMSFSTIVVAFNALLLKYFKG